ncbi:hypothetical protein SAMN05192573_104453 [Mucilaginibacter gossypii]|uniref:Uncharacterized protein n=1 Tax=Mucilaginibacter gossypii TaxID=551996 RepID=A0A1G7WM33_9SPHI|nr:hypothetical protein SAMN05192573_104453 [Mucilaginibacter gossypii]
MPKPITLLLLILLLALHKTEIPDSKRATDVRLKIWPKLQKELKDKGFAPMAQCTSVSLKTSAYLKYG